MEPSEKAIHIAAQCWRDPETSDRVMDDKLAMAFAKRLSPLLDKIDWYEADERVRYTCRLYSELDADGKLKIDNLMSALIALSKYTTNDRHNKGDEC